MKIAPLYHALKKEEWVETIIVHTGQHYDLSMSEAFFTDLRLPMPHIHLGVGSGSHAEQTGHVMMAYEKIILEKKPDLIIVAGDVNSTLACTLAAVKVNYPIPSKKNNPTKHTNLANSVNRPIIAHLEAGLRSFDRTMPEEINRIITDALTDILWTPSTDGNENLLAEGIKKDKIEFVGNIMIDSLEMMREAISMQNSYADFNQRKKEYGVVTFHRPANVDNKEIMYSLCDALISISKKLPLIFPVHPRTRKKLQQYGLIEQLKVNDNIILCEPLSYVRFMSLIFNCRIAITDSGGIQEETTYLGIPCLTMRPNTERPITVSQGTNQLCTRLDIQEKVVTILNRKKSEHRIPHLWDGKTAERVVDSIKHRFWPCRD